MWGVVVKILFIEILRIIIYIYNECAKSIVNNYTPVYHMFEELQERWILYVV